MAIINVEIGQAIERLQLDRPVTFLLAVSGGPDSQCLLKAFPHVCKPLGHECIAIGINHGLRKEADSELDLAESLAKIVGVPFARRDIHIEGRSNLQSKARDARYDAMRWFGSDLKCKFLVTAHHFDDRAETVLIRLIRGDGAGSLAILPEVEPALDPHVPALFRPLLHVTRSDILGYLRRWGISYASDPSNENTHYLRVKIRKEILPVLEQLNPQIRRRLNNLSDELLRLGLRNGTPQEED